MVIQKKKRSRKNKLVNKVKPPPSLLSMPAELRNKIYEYALASPSGISMTFKRGATRKRKKPVTMTHAGEKTYTNQLKYVNRQLFRETAGLEIQYNRVIFEYPTLRTSAIHLFTFAKYCSPPKLSWLTHVVLQEQKKTKYEATVLPWLKREMQIIVDLLDYAAAHPHMTIYLHLPNFRLKDTAEQYMPNLFLSAGIILTLMFRGEDIRDMMSGYGSMTRDSYQEMYNSTLGEYTSRVEKIRDRSRNLRFLPPRTDWDAAIFLEKAVDNWKRFASTPLPDVEGQAVWVRCVQQWMEHGV